MRVFQYISTAVIGMVIVACESVIDVPLNEANIRTVVEGQLTDSLGESFVKLSKTGTVYDDGEFEKISGATITVTEGVSVYSFTEDPLEAGTYLNPAFKTEPNKLYELSVDIGGDLLTATSETFDDPLFQDTYFEAQYNFFSEFDPSEPDSIYQVYYDFPDNGAQTNFYRVNCSINGEQEDFYYIFNDKLFQGENNVSPLWAAYIIPGDTIGIELQSIDESRYKYLFTLASNAAGAGGPTPANPTSNIVGDAIGFFSAITTDTTTVLIPF